MALDGGVFGKELRFFIFGERDGVGVMTMIDTSWRVDIERAEREEI